MEDIVKDQVSLIPNAFTAIARVYAYVGMLEASFTAFERMEKYDCIPDSHTFNIMIDALVKAGFPKQAYGMYDKMLQHVLLTNLYIFNLLVYSFWQEEKPRDVALFKMMKEKGEVSNINTYNFLANGLSKAGEGRC